MSRNRSNNTITNKDSSKYETIQANKKNTTTVNTNQHYYKITHTIPNEKNTFISSKIDNTEKNEKKERKIKISQYNNSDYHIFQNTFLFYYFIILITLFIFLQ